MLRLLLIVSLVSLSLRTAAADDSPTAGTATPSTPGLNSSQAVERKPSRANGAALSLGIVVGGMTMAFVGREKNYGRTGALLTTGWGGARLAAGRGMFVAKAAGVTSPTPLKTIGLIRSVVGALGG